MRAIDVIFYVSLTLILVQVLIAVTLLRRLARAVVDVARPTSGDPGSGVDTDTTT